MRTQRKGLWTIVTVLGLVVLSVGAVLAQPPAQGQGGQDGERRRGDGRPPMMMMQTQMVATDDYVYILRGNTLYQYDTVELKLRNKAELEAPQWPGRPGGQGGGAQNPPAQ